MRVKDIILGHLRDVTELNNNNDVTTLVASRLSYVEYLLNEYSNTNIEVDEKEVINNFFEIKPWTKNNFWFCPIDCDLMNIGK